MIRRLALAVLVLTACSPEKKNESIEGRWRGSAVAFGDSSPLTVDFRADSDSLRAFVSMTSEAMLFEKPLRNVILHGDSLHMELANNRGEAALFDGYVMGDTINGSFRKNANQVYVKLVRTAKSLPPRPYEQKNLRFASKDGTVLEGTVYLPETRAPHPAVVFIHGSGPSDRSDFNYLADAFARRGIAALAYDKRGAGRSGGDPNHSSIEKLAEDVSAGVAALAQRSEIDPQRIGICGVSEGGWVAPIVASRDSSVSFVVAVVAPGSSYESNAIYQNAARLRAARASEKQIDSYVRLTTEVNSIVRARLKNPNDTTLGNRVQAAESKLATLRRDPVYAASDLPRSVPAGEQLARWRWQTMDFDPYPYWTRVHVPTLVVLGESDRNVDSRVSVTRIGEALRSGGNKDVRFVVFDNANHDLMVPGPGRGFRFPVPAPGYPDTLASWTMTKVARR